MFIAPHPDDIEFTSTSACKQAVDLGWTVHEVLMTSDEYGTHRNEFKGKRIKRIRMHEMEEAAKTYGTNADGTLRIQLTWFGEIDGHLPFTKTVLSHIKRMILEFKPRIVFAPDSFFTLDFHPDHLHTGWLVYLAIKSMPESDRPVLLLYHSFKNDVYIRVKDRAFLGVAWSKHLSQTTPLRNKISIIGRVLFFNLRRYKTGPAIAEGFRHARFKLGENIILNFWRRVVYYVLAKVSLNASPGELYQPSPDALGLL